MGKSVIRQCDKCSAKGTDGDGFSYRGDGVFSCSMCGSMRTRIIQIIEQPNNRLHLTGAISAQSESSHNARPANDNIFLEQCPEPTHLMPPL